MTLTRTHYKILCLALTASLFSPHANASDKKFVTSVTDFKIHMDSHIARVQILGNYLYRQHREEFPLVDKKTLQDFLALHDQSKVNMTSKFYREHHLANQSASILQELYAFYGVDRLQLTAIEREAMEAVIKKLNQVDVEVRDAFFAKHHLLKSDNTLSAAAKQYLQIEKIADVVDRGEAKVSTEEFHGKMSKASVFLHELADQNYARELEEKYSLLTRNLDFENFKLLHYRHHRCDAIYEHLLLDKRATRYIYPH